MDTDSAIGPGAPTPGLRFSPGTARCFTLAHPQGLRIAVMDIGATWLSCEVPLATGERREVLLGCDSADDYARQTAYLGAIIGRYANRIRDAAFTLDGRCHRLAANNGPHNLHGGPDGFDRRRWRLVSHQATELVLALGSADGDQGFPGHAQVQVRYALSADAVQIDFEAQVDAACPLALTSHAYFNLDGASPGGDIRAQSLRIAADRYVPVDATLAPLGGPAAVAGTPFDFRQRRRIGDAAWPQWLRDDAQLRHGAGYDHSFLLDEACQRDGAPAAELVSADGRLAMRLHTDQPALQCYSGNHLAGTPARGGGRYGAHAGLALEPGFPPDSPNRPDWAHCILRPGERRCASMRMVFSAPHTGA